MLIFINDDNLDTETNVMGFTAPQKTSRLSNYIDIYMCKMTTVDATL